MGIFKWRGRVSKQEFRKQFVEKLQAEAPQLQCTLSDTDELEVTVSGSTAGNQSIVSLHRAYAEFEQDPSQRDDILERFMGLVTRQREELPLDTAHVVPMIKTRGWLNDQYARDANPPVLGSDDAFWVDEYNDELVVVYAEHREGFSYRPRSDFAAAGLSQSDIRARALDNLRSRTPKREFSPVNGAWLLNAEGAFEASLLLDDEVWKTAAVLKDFYQIQPGDNIPPSKPTEVLIGFDAKFLYIAFKATDESDKVRATVAKRDNIFQDDYVGVMLDTFNDKRKAFEVFFNPLGIQGDGIITEGRGEDFSVDILMESKGIVHETGFDVEIAIPFKSLRFEAGKGKLWGAHFFRRIKRFENELDSWMPFSRSIDSNLSQAGHLTGLEGISVERTIELIPSLTFSENGRFVHSFGFGPGTNEAGRIVNEPLRFDAGLTAKFIPSSAVTVDLAINPDFAQVEADQLVVTANQRFPIFFPEKRPFFLEGIDIFRTQIAAVHTRTIVDPDYAAKLTGKVGRNTIGLLLASDNNPGNFSEEDLPTANPRL